MRMARIALARTRSEKKFDNLIVSDLNVDWDGSVISIDPNPVQGVGAGNRIGTRIFATRTVLKVRLEMDISEVFQNIRIICGTFIGTALPNVTDVIAGSGDDAATLEYYDVQNAGTYNIKYDRIHTLYNDGGKSTKVFWIKLFWNQQLSFDVGDGVPNNNRFFMIAISDVDSAGAVFPTITFNGKAYYRDK